MDALLRRRLMMQHGGGPTPPTPFVRYDWIRTNGGSGGAYIPLGIYTGSWAWEMIFQLDSPKVAASIIGGRESLLVGERSVIMDSAVSGTQLRQRYGNRNMTRANSTTGGHKYRLWGGYNCYLQDLTAGTAAVTMNTVSGTGWNEPSQPCEVALFTLYNQNTYGGATTNCCKFYELKISSGYDSNGLTGDLTHHFVMGTYNGISGTKDLITDEFKTSPVGVLTVGND